MKFNLKNQESVYLRFKLAEILASRKLKAILTTKYPPEVLDTESFDEMPIEDKEFLKKYWTTFDIFKPIFEITNEIPIYKDFIVYEIKSLRLKEEDKEKMNEPIIRISFNQKKFFEECKQKDIPVKIFVVFFLEKWEVEYREFDYDKIKTEVKPHSIWYEEKLKRIKSSKLNQFWHDLFPNYILYKIKEEDLEKEHEEFIKELVSTPLNDEEKRMLTKRAKKTGRKLPDFEDDIEKRFNKEQQKRKSKYKGKSKNINHGKPWDTEQEKELFDLFSKGKEIKEIAEIFGRTRGSIRSRLVKMGLLEEKI